MKKTIYIVTCGLWACILSYIVLHFFDYILDVIQNIWIDFNVSHTIKDFIGLKGPISIAITWISYCLIRHIDSNNYELKQELWLGKVKTTKWGIIDTIAHITLILSITPSILSLGIYLLVALLAILPIAIYLCVAWGPLYFILKKT